MRVLPVDVWKLAFQHLWACQHTQYTMVAAFVVLCGTLSGGCAMDRPTKAKRIKPERAHLSSLVICCRVSSIDPIASIRVKGK